MKTIIIIVSLFMLPLSLIWGQGFETFENFTLAAGTYGNGSFTGTDGSEWTYFQCRGDKAIELPTPCLGKKRNPLSRLCSGLIHNGCRKIIFLYRQAFSTAVNVNLLINGEVIKNFTSPGGYSDTAEVHSSDSIIVNLPGDFYIEFSQADSLYSGQVSIDNIFWSSFEQGLGRDDEIAGEGRDGFRVDCPGEQLVRVQCNEPGEKQLIVYSFDGRPVKESSFQNCLAEIRMDNCRKGMYVLILRIKNTNLFYTAKLLLH